MSQMDFSSVHQQPVEHPDNKAKLAPAGGPTRAHASAIGQFKAKRGGIRGTEGAKPTPQPVAPEVAKAASPIKATRSPPQKLAGMLKRVGQAIAHAAKSAKEWGANELSTMFSAPPGLYDHIESEKKPSKPPVRAEVSGKGPVEIAIDAGKLVGKGLRAAGSAIKSRLPSARSEKTEKLQEPTEAQKKETAFAAIFELCTVDPTNQSDKFAATKTKSSLEDLQKKGISHLMDHVETTNVQRGDKTVVYTDVFVKDDPKSFVEFDLEDKKELVQETSCGKISGQINKDINERPPNIEGLNLKSVPQEKRAETVMEHISSEIENSFKDSGECPSKESINKIAQYALAGITQSFEGPAAKRLQDHSSEVLLEAKLVGSDDTVLTAAGSKGTPSSFRVWVEAGAVHVEGKCYASIQVIKPGTPQPLSMGDVEVTRHYSIPIDGSDARRYPDSYSMA